MFALRLVLILACLGISDGVSLNGQAPPKEVTKGSLQRSLEDTAKEMLSILRSGNPDQLLDLMSKEGVVFGLEPPPISMKELRKQFKAKRGTYCPLFDSSCLNIEQEREWKRGGAKGPFPKVLSYRDRLRQGSVKQIRAFAGNGQVHVLVDNANPIEYPDGIEVLEFGFVRESGQWKLAAVTYG